MGKQHTCPIEASNIAMLGSDLEKKVKAAAAECERAWDGVERNNGIRIWRIEKFKVVEWPRNQIGKFYNGDSYIVLHSYKLNANAPIKHDIHFWLGKATSQDEAGTAAYKTVELDDRLGGAPVQHREVQDHESDLFLGYFPENTIEILEGGIDSGFNHVEAAKYQPRLLHVKGNRQNVRVKQTALTCDSLNSGDSFILDLGLTLIQWNGKEASMFEKMRAGQMVRAIRDERGGKPEAYIYDEDSKEAGLQQFWDALGGKKKIKPAKAGGSDAEAASDNSAVKLFRLSDKSKKLTFTLEKTGNISKSDLDSNDAFILDNGAEVFVWIGKKASADERKHGMSYASQYVVDNGLPPYTPISRVVEGGENQVFNLNFGELTRDLDLNAPEGGRAPCCPHYPEGTDKWSSVQSGASSGAGAAAGGANRGAGSIAALAAKFGGNSSKIQPEAIEKAAAGVFSFFQNRK